MGSGAPGQAAAVSWENSPFLGGRGDNCIFDNASRASLANAESAGPTRRESMIRDCEAQLFGKLSSLEFVIEVMLANELANLPQNVSDEFKAEILDRPGYIQKGPVDVDDLEAIGAETKASLENLIAKVARREQDIRARIARGR
jgi:hypothetical protein